MAALNVADGIKARAAYEALRQVLVDVK